MAWEQRGNNRYYYRKERVGSTVKSIYVGRGDVAHMVAQIQSTTPLLEKLTRTNKSLEVLNAEKAEAAFDLASDLIQAVTHAALLAAGYHTHHRLWRRKRNVGKS